ncbi:MAG: TlpA family protein disulfide reductase, partial [Acidobacteria bacterium]|nr:TlpA family protein disulfide reductase [Acidobacteriota bacterium]
MVQCRVWALATCLVLLGCAEQGSTSPDADLDPASEQESSVELGVVQPGSPEPGGQAPDFALRDMDKQIVRLSDFRGTPIVLNFFASWCVPCLAEMPLIQDAHLKAEEAGYMVLGVAVQDRRGALRGLSESMGLTFPM